MQNIPASAVSMTSRPLELQSEHSPKKAYRYFGENVEEESEHGEVNPDALSSKSESEILWHSEHLGRHVHWHEPPAQHQDEEH